MEKKKRNENEKEKEKEGKKNGEKKEKKRKRKRKRKRNKTIIGRSMPISTVTQLDSVAAAAPPGPCWLDPRLTVS